MQLTRNRLLPLLLIVLACLFSQVPPASVQAADPPAAVPQARPDPLPFVEGSWSLVLLPDTQNYAMRHPHIFTSQTRWIVENHASRSIAFVLHEGDITNNNNAEQWQNARDSLSLLDGVVPYALAPGNHDFGPNGGTASRDTMLNRFFPIELYENLPTFGGVYQTGKLDNSYHLFSAGGRDWLAIALEFGPRDSVIKWASKVLEKYPDRTAMVVTHAYLYSDDTRYDYINRSEQKWNPHRYPADRLHGSVNDGQELWDKLISKHHNMAFVFCGHVLNDGAALLTSTAVHGNQVHQMLANYQMLPEGGQGYLRLVEFLPDGKTVQVKTYSPYKDDYLTGDQQQFVLDLPPVLAEAR